jgi:3-phenylpropionate/cinnamic acid dioxygenase small subunit
MTKNAAASIPNVPELDNRARKVRLGSPIYNLISEFLIEEAALLDSQRIREWIGLLAPDILYSAPVRVTRKSADSQSSIDRGTLFFHDDLDTLKLRVTRVEDTPSAWAEDPPSRTRRFITNIAVWNTNRADEFEVKSNLLLARNRNDLPAYQWITAERHDTVRLIEEDTLRLVRREIIFDRTVSLVDPIRNCSSPVDSYALRCRA